MRTVLSRPDFRLLFGGLLASMTAESVLLLALAVWVKDLTGSDGLAGATIFVLLVPRTLAPLVGWFVDRYPRRPFFVVTNLATALLLTPLRGPRRGRHVAHLRGGGVVRVVEHDGRGGAQPPGPGTGAAGPAR
ncbi:hypothetical protein GCM10029963_58740 [Micromonospora andamanensis]